MPEGISLDTSVPTGLTAPEAASKEHANDAQNVDAEILAVLATTQNACLKELGYAPTLLRDFHELQKQHAQLQQQYLEVHKSNVKLHGDNAKLYTDNRTLASFLQEQHRKLSESSTDQQKRSIAELHDQIRLLTAQRDELSGRLYSAYHDIGVLRQELVGYTSRGLPPGATTKPQPDSRSERHPVAMQVVIPASTLPNMAQQPPLPQHKQGPPGFNTVQPTAPLQLTSLPTLAPLNTMAAPPPSISYRRPSAPEKLVSGNASSLVQSPLSASHIQNFSGMTLADSNPITPVSSRPGTSQGQAPASTFPLSASGPPSRPSTSYTYPLVPQQMGTSCAVIDLSNESELEDVARKRRKLDHAPAPVAGPSGVNVSISAPAVPARQPEKEHPSPIQVDTPPHTGTLTGSHLAKNDASDTFVKTMKPTTPVRQQPTEPPPPCPQPPAAPVQDVTMVDEDEEPQTTIEEDCLEVNYDEDEADETKKWCRMCRSRQRTGVIKEALEPFINASQQTLIDHCENVHPAGWNILKSQLTKARAEEQEAV